MIFVVVLQKWGSRNYKVYGLFGGRLGIEKVTQVS